MCQLSSERATPAANFCISIIRSRGVCVRTEEWQGFDHGNKCQHGSGLVEKLRDEEEDEGGAVNQADRFEDHVGGEGDLGGM